MYMISDSFNSYDLHILFESNKNNLKNQIFANFDKTAKQCRNLITTVFVGPQRRPELPIQIVNFSSRHAPILCKHTCTN